MAVGDCPAEGQPHIPGPLPFPTGAWRLGSLQVNTSLLFIGPGSQAPAVFVQIRVRLLYKPHSSFPGHPAAAPLTSPAGPLFAISKQTALNKPLGRPGCGDGRSRQPEEQATGSWKLPTALHK